MPKVTQYGGPKAETQVVQGPRAKSYQLAGVGQLAPALNEVARTVQTMQDSADKSAAEEALIGFEREKNDMFFNPETGYFNNQGRDAYDSAKPTSDGLNELKKKYGSTLKSPKAQSAFSRAADAHITRANADIMRHSSTQLKAWETATIKARVENTTENAALYWNDEDTLKLQSALGRQAVIEAAGMEGVGGEVLNERLQNFSSSFAKNAIAAANNSSSADAEKLMEKYGSSLEGPDRIAVESAIARKKKSEEVQRRAQQTVQLSASLIGQVGDEPNARSLINESVNNIEDLEVRRAVHKEANRMMDAKMKADSEERAAIFEAGENYMMNPNNAGAEGFKMENPDAWEKLSPTQKRKLEAGEPISTDYVKLNEMLIMPKEKLQHINPADYYQILAPADRQKLVGAVASARNGSPESQVGRTRAAETKASITDMYGAPGAKGYKGEKAKQVNSYYALIDSEVAFREEQKGGAKLSSTEYTAVLNDVARKFVQEGYVWDSELDITDVPAQYTQQLADYLHRNNIPATGDNIIKAFNDPEHKAAAGIKDD